MKTSVKKFNKQYKYNRLYLDGYNNPEIVKTCNEHKRCDVCPTHSHVELCSWSGNQEGALDIYVCPTCGKSYVVLQPWPDEEEAEHEPKA